MGSRFLEREVGDLKNLYGKRVRVGVGSWRYTCSGSIGSPRPWPLGYVYNWECVGGSLICLQPERHRLPHRSTPWAGPS